MTAMTFDTPLRRPRPTRAPSGSSGPCAAPRATSRGARPRAATRHARPVPVPYAPAAVAPAVAARPGRVRLTRRGRVLLLLTLVTLLLVAFSLGRTSADAGHGAPATRHTTVVQPGETLWSIARRVAPAADPRVTVDRLTHLNDLGARPIVAGQRLVLPS
jgi:hypothetical protein